MLPYFLHSQLLPQRLRVSELYRRGHVFHYEGSVKYTGGFVLQQALVATQYSGVALEVLSGAEKCQSETEMFDVCEVFLSDE